MNSSKNSALSTIYLDNNLLENINFLSENKFLDNINLNEGKGQVYIKDGLNTL